MSKENNGWISMEERLPDKFGMYLIFINPLGEPPLYKGTGAHPIRSDLYDPYLKEHGFTYGNVTHWQPLPKPPTA